MVLGLSESKEPDSESKEMGSVMSGIGVERSTGRDLEFREEGGEFIRCG